MGSEMCIRDRCFLPLPPSARLLQVFLENVFSGGLLSSSASVMKWFASAQTRFGFDAPPCTHISVGISRIGAQAARVCGRGPEDKSGHALDRCAVLATACWRNRENPSAFRGQQSLEHPIRSRLVHFRAVGNRSSVLDIQ